MVFLEDMSKDMCENSIYVEEHSPAKQLKAVVFDRSGGATTAYSTRISILSAADKLNNTKGNVFISSGHPKRIDPVLTWESEASLLVRSSTISAASKSEDSWGFPNRVSIRYGSRK